MAELQRLKEATAGCIDVIRLNPDNSRLYLERAEARSSQDLYEEAVVDYRRAIRFDPDSAAAYLGCRRAESEVGSLDAAIADDNWRSASIRTQPKHPRTDELANSQPDRGRVVRLSDARVQDGYRYAEDRGPARERDDSAGNRVRQTWRFARHNARPNRRDPIRLDASSAANRQIPYTPSRGRAIEPESGKARLAPRPAIRRFTPPRSSNLQVTRRNEWSLGTSNGRHGVQANARTIQCVGQYCSVPPATENGAYGSRDRAEPRHGGRSLSPGSSPVTAMAEILGVTPHAPSPARGGDSRSKRGFRRRARRPPSRQA